MPTNTEIEAELYKITDEYSIETFPSEHRNHLGVSVIGDDCWRKLWFGFRWVKLEQPEPRMRRLFNRGHREEEEFAKILSYIGFYVRTIDPETDKQYRFSAVDGHYGGSNDSLALPPWDRDTRILVEYKTHNNKSFEDLKANKLKKSKPVHFAQMCGYGKEFKCKNGLYCAKNKDNEEIYYEWLDLDWQYAEELEKKAKEIIYAKFPPPRISEQPSYWKCRYCSFKGVCHDKEPVEKNCRSCQMSEPVDNGQWKCNRFNSIIPKEYIKNGCEYHLGIV